MCGALGVEKNLQKSEKNKSGQSECGAITWGGNIFGNPPGKGAD